MNHDDAAKLEHIKATFKVLEEKWGWVAALTNPVSYSIFSSRPWPRWGRALTPTERCVVHARFASNKFRIHYCGRRLKPTFDLLEFPPSQLADKLVRIASDLVGK